MTFNDLERRALAAGIAIEVCEGAQVPPPAAREALRRAARTPIPDHDPLARERAINAAVRGVKLLHPELFHREEPLQ